MISVVIKDATVKMLKPAWVLCLLPLFAQLASAELYQYSDSSGVTHFTDDSRKVPAKVRARQEKTTASLPPSSSPLDERGRTGWLTNSDFQAAFDKLFADGYYTTNVEGRLHRDVMQFRGTFKPFFKGLNRFYSYHGMFDESYKQRKAKFESEGFKELYHNVFVDVSGRQRHQACWLETL